MNKKIFLEYFQKLKKWHPDFSFNNELNSFLENFSSLLSAGVPILVAFESTKTEIKSERLRNIISKMADDVNNGVSLSNAIKNSGLFSQYVSVLVNMGEKSGRLVENLKIVSIEEEKKRALKSKIKSAMMYPVFVIVVTLIVGIAITWFVLPKLSLVFTQLKMDLPFVTQTLINFGNFLHRFGIYAFLLIILVFGLFYYFLFKYQKTKHIGEGLLFVLPGAKDLLKQAEISRFGYLLGTLLKAGLSPSESLYSLSEATNYLRYKKLYIYLGDSVSEGNSFKKAFLSKKEINNLLPDYVRQLIVASEQSGNLPDTLIKISEVYENKTDTLSKNMTVILEPILLVIVWLGVVAVALAVILPIYNLVGQLNI